MANEAVIVELLGDPKGQPVSYICADNVGIEKGTILWLAEDRTISSATLSGKPFAGIAAHEKVANDGSTHIGCWTCGIFDLTNGPGAIIPVGNLVYLSGGNLINGGASASMVSGGAIIGKALETGSVNEVIQVAVGIY